MSRFLPLIDWRRFRRRNFNEEARHRAGRYRVTLFDTGRGEVADRRDHSHAGGELLVDAVRCGRTWQ